MYGSDWLWSTVSLCCAFGVTVITSLAGSRGPASVSQLLVAALVAVAPVVWTPVMIIRAAIPVCGTDKLLYDQDTQITTLPSNATVITTKDTVLDDATQAMALGVLMIGGGATMLILHLSIEQMYRKSMRIKTGAAWTVFSLVLIGLGIYPMYDQAINTHPWRWSDDSTLDNTLRAQCTAGSGAIFGSPLAAQNRDLFYDLVMAAFFAAAGAVGVCAIVAVVAAAQPSKSALRLLTCGCGIVVAGALGLGTVVLSEVVFMGTNPRCAEAVLTTGRNVGLGIVAVALGCSALSMYAVFATRARPTHPSQVQTYIIEPSKDDEADKAAEPKKKAPTPPPRAPGSPKEWIGWTGRNSPDSDDEDDEDDISEPPRSPMKRYLLPRNIESQSTAAPSVQPQTTDAQHGVTTTEPEWDDGGLGTSFESTTTPEPGAAQAATHGGFSYAPVEEWLFPPNQTKGFAVLPPPPPAMLESDTPYFLEAPADNGLYFEQDNGIYKSADV